MLSKYLTHAEIFIDVPDKNSKEAYEAKIALIEYVHQAKLYLNESEKKSGDLLQLMQELPNKYSKVEHAAKEYQNEKPKISSLMQDVLKEEWNRVRDGEILWSINNFFKLIRLPKWFYISRIRLFWASVLLIALYSAYRFCTYGVVVQA
nr:J31 [uncultured bacterium]